jgi:formate dehydrogenase subunit gamma
VSPGSLAAVPVTDEAIRSVVRSVADRPGPLLLALQALQQAFGYVDPRAVPVVADELNLSRAEVHGVLTFYSDLRTTPPGRHHVQVCRAEACQARGAAALVSHAQASLGTGLGGTTADGAVTLDGVFCLGNCALGPAVAVDGHLHGRVDASRFDSLVQEVRA